MPFTDELRAVADPIFSAIKRHPFVLGISQAKLQPAQLIHYVSQDFQYLNTYIQVYGLGIARCSTREEMRNFYTRIGFVLNDEVHPHLNFCRVAQVNYADLQKQAALAPTAHHYARHMLSVAESGSLGEILATLLPCHWTYVEIGQEIVETIHPTAAHAFYEWIQFYNSDAMHASLSELRDWLDSYAADAGARERARMRDAFITSCHLELRFFEMAYSLESW